MIFLILHEGDVVFKILEANIMNWLAGLPRSLTRDPLCFFVGCTDHKDMYCSNQMRIGRVILLTR